MAIPKLQMPEDSGSEIYLNSNTLSVSFQKNRKYARGNVRRLRVVLQAYGQIIEDRLFTAGSAITFGMGEDTFKVSIPGLPEKHPLITYHLNGSVTLQLKPEFLGILQIDEKLVPVQGDNTIEIKLHPRGVIELGTVRIYFEEIDDPEKIQVLRLSQKLNDGELNKWLKVSLAIHLLLLLVIRLIPTSDLDKKIYIPTNAIKILIEPTQIPRYEPMSLPNTLPPMQAQNIQPTNEQSNQSHTDKKVITKKTVQTDSPLKKVRDTALLSILSNGKITSDLMTNKVTDSAETLTIANQRSGLPGEITGRKSKNVAGIDGVTNNGTASIKGLNTNGSITGKKNGGLVDLKTGSSRTSVVASIDPETSVVGSSLTKDQIANVIGVHMGQIQYCYERQLQKDPNLRGKLLVNFVIGLSGGVAQAAIKNTTMKNASVESCVTNAFKQMQFPTTGSGTVEVSYPLIFNVAGNG